MNNIDNNKTNGQHQTDELLEKQHHILLTLERYNSDDERYENVQ